MISGKTRVVVHLAHPAAHLRTPGVFNAWCREHDHDAVLVPWQVAPDALAAAVDGLRRVESLAGVVVTIPHKGAMAGLCDTLSPTARSLGVVNAARRDADGRLHGAMFDGDGFVAGLAAEGHAIAGRRALLIGAGGAATGIADALLRAGVAELAILNRSAAKAAALAHSLAAAYPAARVSAHAGAAAGFDLVVNGTSLGMHDGDPLPIDPTTLDPGSLVAEVVMQPDVTRLLAKARERGCRVHRGIHMITGQVALLARFLLA